MRGAVHGARTSIEAAAFGWERELAAVLRHSTLPWREALEATPLREQPPLGGRDRLSLLAQFAAHEALLRFAGIGDAAYEPAEWAVVQQRGMDARLIRLAARSTPDPPPALTLVQQFAEAVGAPPLDALRASWGRPEAVYCEIDQRLRGDAAADVRWMRRAALGEIASPAPDGLRTLAAAREARLRYSDDACIESIRMACDRVLVLGETPSPLAPLRPLALGARNDSEIVERLLAAERLIVIVTGFDRFDPAARRVVELFAATGSGVLLMPGGNDVPESRFFVVSPRLEPRRALDEMLAARGANERRVWLRHFVRSDAFAAFIDDGALPSDGASLDALREPNRSLLAALALLGPRIPRPLAERFLRQFLFGGTLHDLAIDGVACIDDEALVFAGEGVRRQAAQLVPAASRASLCRVAAQLAEEEGDLARAAALLLDAGDAKRAAALLGGAAFASDDDAVRALRALPRGALSPPLATTLARALIRGGRYRDAREVASALDGDARETMLAAIERRTGDYGPALARLERVTRDAGAELLRAELLYLEARYDEAAQALEACEAESDAQRDRRAYLRAIIELDNGRPGQATIGDPYLAARLAFYRTNALDDALRALAAAGTVAERIDAALDHLFALFTAGRWADARAAALDALTVIDETQGDRAAGGILFLLAYLAADDGQCSHGAHLIARLERFYAATGDERRLRELDLLRAQLELARGRFAAAARFAAAVAGSAAAPQIVEAARLVLDEVDAAERRRTPLRSTGMTANVELTARHALLRARHDGAPVQLPARTPEHLRVALAGGPAAGRGAPAEERDDVRLLRLAATAVFPFAPHDFGALRWRFATQNRLGHWSEIGSLPPLDRATLDRHLAAAAGDWMVCGERELLYVEGAQAWPAEGRDAVAALFRIRSQNHRLARAAAQEELASAPPREVAVEGIVGDSAAMRDVLALIHRVARRDVAVCILGESGTGKELVAHALHRHSARRGKSFTAVNCAALPETLIESELFGCARGAFTGADRDRAGLIETSDGGTLFLDEIGELPPAAQAKLLRFLQDGEFRRVGDAASRTADVRVVTATNRKLEKAVEEGRFREDLYYRVRGIEITLPPLRERDGDILLLAAHFLAREREKHRGGPASMTADAAALIAGYHWPGNVRELQNTVRAAHALAGEAKAIDVEHLPPRLRTARAVVASSYHDAVTRFRRELIERSLDESRGNQNQAAAMLSLSRQALAYQIRELGILVKRR